MEYMYGVFKRWEGTDETPVVLVTIDKEDAELAAKYLSDRNGKIYGEDMFFVALIPCSPIESATALSQGKRQYMVHNARGAKRAVLALDEWICKTGFSYNERRKVYNLFVWAHSPEEALEIAKIELGEEWG